MTTIALKDNPCTRDCPDRSGTCHGDCPKFAKYNAKNEARRAAKRKDWPCHEYTRDKGTRAERKQRANK